MLSAAKACKIIRLLPCALMGVVIILHGGTLHGADVNLVVNGSFEANPIPNDPFVGNFTQPDYADGWLASDFVGLNTVGGAFNGAAVIPHGEQVLWIQQESSISQVISGTESGESYTLRFSVNARPAPFQAPLYTVSFGGTELIAQTEVIAGSFQQVALDFVAPDGADHVLEFRGYVSAPGNDSTFLIDAVSIVQAGEADPFAPVENYIVNGSFEANPVPNEPGIGNFTQPDYADGWVTRGSVGLNTRNGAFNSGARIPHGEQVLWIQQDSDITQKVTGLVPSNSYTLHYRINARPAPFQTPIHRVTLGELELVPPTPVEAGQYQTVSVDFVAPDGDGELALVFSGQIPNPGEDPTFLIDAVAIVDQGRPDPFGPPSQTWPVTPVEVVNMGPGSTLVETRSVPFVTRNQPRSGPADPIRIESSAEVMLLLGMVNFAWDVGLAHWGEQPELWEDRIDQVHIGVNIGEVEVHYADGDIDTIPMTIGSTAWFVTQWANGPSHMGIDTVREPFASRPELMEIYQEAIQLHEHHEPASTETAHHHFYLAVSPKPKVVDRLIIQSNDGKRGQALISGVTLVGGDETSPHLERIGDRRINPDDILPAFSLSAMPDLAPAREALARNLYTSMDDLPREVDPLSFPEDIQAATLRFHGDQDPGTPDIAGMLNNIWVANIINIHEKFDPVSGAYIESGENMPWYGGYNGIGTWEELGIYGTSYTRTSDHYASLALRVLRDQQRITSYVDHVDKWLHFYRPNHDPEQGPPNDQLDVARYPADAPPHWGFVLEVPLVKPWAMNEIPGTEEMDGHASVMIGRWWAWRLMGSPTDDWLMEPRAHRFGNSRYDDTVNAANFICWLMEHTGRDVIFSEGESTAWGGGPEGTPGTNVFPGWPRESDPDILRQHYSNADVFYQTYPTFASYIALRLSSEKAEAVGDTEHFEKWNSHADRIYHAMLAELAIGNPGEEVWKVAFHSVFPSFNEALVQTFLSTYREGYHAADWDPALRAITRRTLDERLQRPNSGRAVIGMGYGQGWMLHAALAFDEMDAVDQLITDLAIYTYDKNMDYQDPTRDIDWRDLQWIIPEGTNILPDGSWYRISDLGNGANQGPSMQAILYSAGVDDSQPDRIRLIPRIAGSMNRMELHDLQTVVASEDGGTAVALVTYDYRPGKYFLMSSSLPLPGLSVRLGPFANEAEATGAIRNGLPIGATTRVEASGTWQGGTAWWVWAEKMDGASSLILELPDFHPSDLPRKSDIWVLGGN
ncbi:MAG: DUF642 domain-containing protein [Candidatus Sumerlaeia bacterium]|nr:DUF642 domain-containing protein [Candidatus Sumerlaeia bacterium]